MSALPRLKKTDWSSKDPVATTTSGTEVYVHGDAVVCLGFEENFRGDMREIRFRPNEARALAIMLLRASEGEKV